MNMNSMSEVLNKFAGVLENRNKKFSNKEEDFLMPLSELTRIEMKDYFYNIAPGFVHSKGKNLLTNDLPSENELSEKQMYDIYQISQNLNIAATSSNEEVYNKISNAYQERNDLLFIPTLQKSQRTLNTLTTLLLVNHHLPQSQQDRKDLENSIEKISTSVIQSLEEVKKYEEKNEGISSKLNYSVNELNQTLLKFNEQLSKYEETKRIFEKNSKDPFNFNNPNFNNHKIDENASIQEIEKMSSKQVHSMLNLNKNMIELRNQYILRIDDHSPKNTI